MQSDALYQIFLPQKRKLIDAMILTFRRDIEIALLILDNLYDMCCPFLIGIWLESISCLAPNLLKRQISLIILYSHVPKILNMFWLAPSLHGIWFTTDMKNRITQAQLSCSLSWGQHSTSLKKFFFILHKGRKGLKTLVLAQENCFHHPSKNQANSCFELV